MNLPLILTFWIIVQQILPIWCAEIRNIRAFIDSRTNSIQIDWILDSTNRPEKIHYLLKYRKIAVNGQTSEWALLKTEVPRARIQMTGLTDGDQLELTVKAENQYGKTLTKWTPALPITIRRHPESEIMGSSDLRDESLESAQNLQPPLTFRANVIGPRSVRLEWTSPTGHLQEGLYYILAVKRLGSINTGENIKENNNNNEIKVTSNSFVLENLVAGAKYEIKIRSALSPQLISRSYTLIEILMPRELEYFEIGNLLIKSHFDSPKNGVVNLTWNVPEYIKAKIIGQEIEYREKSSNNNNNNKENQWQKIAFDWRKRTVSLRGLTAETDYLLRISTRLRRGLRVQSGIFQFRTSAANPISRVDVMYTNRVGRIRLQLLLERYVKRHSISSYDVYIADEETYRSESVWRRVTVHATIHNTNQRPLISIPNLKPSTVYYVKVNIRYRNGTVLRGQSVYRFITFDPVQF